MTSKSKPMGDDFLYKKAAAAVQRQVDGTASRYTCGLCGGPLDLNDSNYPPDTREWMAKHQVHPGCAQKKIQELRAKGRGAK